MTISAAVPEFSTTAPSDVVPFMKVTIPVGVFVPEAGVTFAVKVMKFPVATGLGLALSAVLVATTGSIVTLTAADVLLLSSLSPP